MQRLQKILSAYGIASRREAEAMIKDGRVCVNGKLALLGMSANPEVDEITVDGKSLAGKKPCVYIMLNKPRGYLTTVSDDRDRKTVMELVADVDAKVYPVGRLDLNSEGLLLLTNDGEFANKVAHPSYNKTKIYEVLVTGDAEKAVQILKKPVSLQEKTANGSLKTITVTAINTQLIYEKNGKSLIRIAIAEGRNRQVRKMCLQSGLKVISLKRVSIAGVQLGMLETGKWRYLTENEVKSLG